MNTFLVSCKLTLGFCIHVVDYFADVENKERFCQFRIDMKTYKIYRNIN